VSSENVIRIVLVRMIMAGWIEEIVDVQGAFLHGIFYYGKTIHMEVPEGFEKHYDPMYYVLLLLKTIYGLKQSAFQFWKAILLYFSSMQYKRSKPYQCLYYKWTVAAMYRVMRYCVATHNLALELKPERKWNEFRIHGKAD
jgi:hypothetical protein